MNAPHRIWITAPFFAFSIGVLVLKSAWSSLLIYHFLLLFPLVIYRDRLCIFRLFRGFSWIAFLLHVIFSVVGYILLTELAMANSVKIPPLESVGLGFCIYFLLVNPVFEEIFWRDLYAKKNLGLSLEDMMFGLFHGIILYPFLKIIDIVIGVVLLSIIAWFWRRIRWKTSGLAIPWLSHFFADAMLVFVCIKLASSN